MANRNLKLILFYDADCGFCQLSINWLKKDLSLELNTIPYQNENVISEYVILDLSLKDKEIQLIQNDKIFSGAKAVGVCLMYKKYLIFKLIGKVIQMPFFLPFFKILYKIIANNRKIISKIMKLQSCKIKL